MTDHATDDDGDGPAPRAADLTYDIDADERPSAAVVRAVASLTNSRVTDLEPLYHVIDPDHLDQLFDRPRIGGAAGDRALTIRFNGCRVTVTADAVHVRELDDEGDGAPA